ncbi:hypothetical protein ACFC1R_08090 [Kitasatospora sp. NPDC056138]|uniref:hypothetical protein n=1 Tax=Kitasatospora sp. NPDC056138 TaxID=3345724 RepID=UPI0035DD3910
MHGGTGEATRPKRKPRLVPVGAVLLGAGAALLFGAWLVSGAGGGPESGAPNHRPGQSASATASATGSPAGGAPSATASPAPYVTQIVVVTQSADKNSDEGDSVAAVITAVAGLITAVAGSITMVVGALRRTPAPAAPSAPATGPDA